MRLLYDDVYLKSFKRITKNNIKLKRKIIEKLNLFLIDKAHHSLRLHKINTIKGGVWSISINMNIRILIQYKGADVILLDIGTREDIY